MDTNRYNVSMGLEEFFGSGKHITDADGRLSAVIG